MCVILCIYRVSVRTFCILLCICSYYWRSLIYVLKAFTFVLFVGKYIMLLSPLLDIADYVSVKCMPVCLCICFVCLKVIVGVGSLTLSLALARSLSHHPSLVTSPYLVSYLSRSLAMTPEILSVFSHVLLFASALLSPCLVPSCPPWFLSSMSALLLHFLSVSSPVLPVSLQPVSSLLSLSSSAMPHVHCLVCCWFCYACVPQ